MMVRAFLSASFTASAYFIRGGRAAATGGAFTLGGLPILYKKENTLSLAG